MWDWIRERFLGPVIKPLWLLWETIWDIPLAIPSWAKEFRHSLLAPRGYLVLFFIISVYVGAYSLNEAQYESRANRAALERSNFITMVSSGNRGAFVAAMQNFGPLQNIRVPPEPSLWWPPSWGWFATAGTPNKASLRQWAYNFLLLCTVELCGAPREKKKFELFGDKEGSKENPAELRIFLAEANLRQADLEGAGLQGADLRRANLWEANLRGADLQGADLRLAQLGGADLARADLRRANLGLANFPRANLGEADLRLAQLGEADLWLADLHLANLEGADLQGADLQGADLSMARGLTREQIQGAFTNETTKLPRHLSTQREP